MKLVYFDRSSRAMIDLTDLEDSVYEVCRVNVPEKDRGKGIARKLMKEMLTDADREGVRLRLCVYASGDLTYEKLVAWYERCGFVEQDGSGYWFREARYFQES